MISKNLARRLERLEDSLLPVLEEPLVIRIISVSADGERVGGRLHRPPACSRRAGGKRAFERPPRDRPRSWTQILRSAGEHLPRRWVLGEPKPADGPFSGGRITGESPPARLLHAGGRWTAPLLENSWIRRRIRRPTRKRRQRP